MIVSSVVPFLAGLFLIGGGATGCITFHSTSILLLLLLVDNSLFLLEVRRDDDDAVKGRLGVDDGLYCSCFVCCRHAEALDGRRLFMIDLLRNVISNAIF